jgi:Domain of unknown function (DUF4376)
MLTTLTIEDRYDPAFIKSLTTMNAQSTWGSGAGDEPGTQNIFFSSAYSDEIADAINGYDAAWLDAQKALRTEAVNVERDARIEGGFSFVRDGETYPIQSAQSDRENVIGLAVAGMGAISQGAQPGDLEWLIPGQPFGFIAADNRVIPLDAQGMMALYQRGLGFKMALTLYARAMKDAMLAAEDLEALAAIELDGWPE